MSACTTALSPPTLSTTSATMFGRFVLDVDHQETCNVCNTKLGTIKTYQPPQNGVKGAGPLAGGSKGGRSRPFLSFLSFSRLRSAE
ncbi:hypothetical protein MBAV_003760 [Candidatus Magnetobacterium bavaricum]|uniref:Uncharacterized protein n=1 Tax=Candidatus Magnetobacterium bavaricum TaxID=29290 RepID=A0A0F3GQ67_9BACT|nr:hypothetical protein MBAV_003760 [Candidatus Magnetobacterium bavaricum]